MILSKIFILFSVWIHDASEYTSYDGLMCFLICGTDGKVCRYQAAETAHQKRGENRAIWLEVGFLVLVIAKILIAVLPDVNRFFYKIY